MNERIQDLADKAHAETYELYLDRLSKEFAGNVIFYNMFNQKFAELIIHEVIREIEHQVFWNGIDTVNNPQWYKAIDRAKRHFGVEE